MIYLILDNLLSGQSVNEMAVVCSYFYK